jgi:putative hydrolase of the HAD superfamily
MKPHPSIFEAALKLVGVAATESLMVGDSFSHDIQGARRVGMRGILVQRSPGLPAPAEPNLPVISDLSDLTRYL